MKSKPVALQCRCGASTFSIRADAAQAVALASCPEGHHSLVLDSRDVWFDVIQDGRPKALHCRCKHRLFAIDVVYEYVERAGPISAVSVRARCASCQSERAVFDQRIDYEPTDELRKHPLDPVEDPWLKARRIELTGLWLPSDLDAALTRLAGLPRARLWFVGWRERPREMNREAITREIVNARAYTLLIANGVVAWPENLRDAWRSLPVVQIDMPIRIHYESGTGDLTYITYATEDVSGGVLQKRPPAFVTFGELVQSSLRELFVGGRGPSAVDNPTEKARLGF